MDTEAPDSVVRQQLVLDGDPGAARAAAVEEVRRRIRLVLTWPLLIM